MKYKLTPTKEPNKKFTNGKIDKQPDGTFNVQLCIMLKADGDISDLKITWLKLLTSETGVKLGTAKKVNIPMNVERNDFNPPYTGFKAKFNISLHGWINGKVRIGDSLILSLRLTGKNLSDVHDGHFKLEDFEGVYNEAEEDFPPEHADSPHSDIYIDAGHDERMKERDLSWIKLTIKRFKEWVSDNKWMLIGIAVSFIAGVIFGKKVI